MTNAEKFLKDGVTPSIFCEACTTGTINVLALKEWLCQDTKPTLTEDERAILRNIDKQYKFIYRDKFGDLHLDYVKPTEDDINCTYVDDSFDYFDIFGHLFQFIKERRRIFY